MGHPWQSLSERLRRVARAIASFPSAIVSHVKPTENHGVDYIYSDDSYEDYIPVMERLKVSRIDRYVETIRAKTRPNQEIIPVVDIGTPTLQFEQVRYRVKFADGASWLLKIPANGTPDQLGDDEAENLRSEALMMKMLRRETTIPIPEVFCFDNTCKNELKVPFILMEYVEGRSLEHVWHDKESPKEVVQARRIRCLQEIAAAYSQLGRYTFNESGNIRFDSQERLVVMTGKGTGSFSDPKKAYTEPLDEPLDEEEQEIIQDDSLFRGVRKLLRMFIDWAPAKQIEGRPFVLVHSNPHLFNFLVAEDGSLRAILDWSGTDIAPRSVGNEAYPRWLIRDWGFLYFWDEGMERGIKAEGRSWEDSPATLSFYRNVYAQSIANFRPGNADAKITRQSLLYWQLILAASDPFSAGDIAFKLLMKLDQLAEKDMHGKALAGPGEDGRDANKEISPKEEDASGDSRLPNGAENDQGDRGGIEVSVYHLGHEWLDLDVVTTALDENKMSKSHEEFLKARFMDLLHSL